MLEVKESFFFALIFCNHHFFMQNFILDTEMYVCMDYVYSGQTQQNMIQGASTRKLLTSHYVDPGSSPWIIASPLLDIMHSNFIACGNFVTNINYPARESLEIEWIIMVQGLLYQNLKIKEPLSAMKF